MSTFRRAIIIRKSLGHYVAARFLARRRVSFEAALWLLCRKEPRA